MSVAILATALLSLLVIGVLFLVPLTPVHLIQTNQVPQTAVDSLFLDFQVDVGQVNVFLENLPGNMAILNVTADGSVSVFDDANHPVNVTFSHQTTKNSQVVIAGVSP